jgi:hypothetical protein
MMSSNITWNSLVPNYSWWEIGLNNATFGGQPFSNPINKLAFIDTGAPYINMPIGDYSTLFHLFEAAIKQINPYVVLYKSTSSPIFNDSCANYLEKLPPLQFNLSEGNIYNVPP